MSEIADTAAAPRSAPASPPTQSASGRSLEDLCINAIRVLSMDAVQKADSGHPGTPMALAPLAYVLWTQHLRYNPSDPDWINRDRFVLSAGHASMLLYSVLYLTGYDVSIDDIRQFRQWESRTPGHPELGYTAGVETTTGPLGQGIGNAIGMAVGAAHLGAVFNQDGHTIIDHHVYFVASDGDLMEGVSHEAASFAGHLKLGKLIGFYDDNHITIEGDTALTYSDDAAGRFTAYGWHVQHIADVNDLSALNRAIDAAKAETSRPSLIIVRSHIGYGSPNKLDTAEAHGSPLGPEEITLTKQALGYPSLEPFHVVPEALSYWRDAAKRRAGAQGKWNKSYAAYKAAFPELERELRRRLKGDLPDGWEEAIPVFTEKDGNVASRAASGVVLNAIAKRVPELIGGSADLASSTNTIIKGEASFSATSYAGRNFHFGIREHGMGSVMNGMSLSGGIIPYGATFLIFSDYMRPTIRLAAFMERHVIYVYTHDSIGLGEDGPTHQPIEQLSALRAIPGLTVIRPADASETAEAWRSALKHRKGPVALVLTRQKLAFIDRGKYASAGGAAKGAYVLADSPGGTPEVVLISSGSEVALILEAQKKLAADGVRARAVSMPSQEIFARQDDAYRSSVLPEGVRRIAMEAAHPMSWYKLVGSDGIVLGIERFGASAPASRLFTELGMTVDRIVDTAKAMVQTRAR
ncbi:MAG TPA: transketolase [Gemmatimonadaceae bacterium]|nr:transketolase [Gemmatimonadaceae bacterium]